MMSTRRGGLLSKTRVLRFSHGEGFALAVVGALRGADRFRQMVLSFVAAHCWQTALSSLAVDPSLGLVLST
jgi:hypothetical protein